MRGSLPVDGPPLTLITIPLSHYCEKARWALDRAGVRYREEGHIPFASRLAGARHGVWSTVPILVTPSGTIGDSTAILEWLDARTPPERRLFPDASDGALRREVDELEAELDRDLGPHARRIVYFHLLADGALARRLLTTRTPPVESAIGRALFPVMRRLIRRGLHVDAEGAARSTAKVDAVFARVAERLADGRGYLAGDRMTAADVTFASLAAPAIAPPGYGFPLPPLAELPDGARRVIDRYRATVAGRFAMRLYDERTARA